MYTTLYTEIKNILDKCTTIQETHPNPVSSDEITGYPAVIYFPGRLENDFETVRDNQKVYRFRMYVLATMEADKTKGEIFKEVLAGVVDDLIDTFDANWGGVIDTHRASYLIDSGTWDVKDTEDGKVAFAELNLRIKVLTSN